MSRFSTLSSRSALQHVLQLGIIAIGIIACSLTASSQTTFTVTVDSKAASHPNPSAHPEVYVIDGVQGKELTLERGVTYTFKMSNVPSFHPFFISTSSTGGDGGTSAYTDGVTGNMISGNSTLTFTPSVAAPALLYYQCANHDNMGWKINIVSNSNSVDDRAILPAGSMLSQASPNPFGSTTNFSLTVVRDQRVRLAVYDSYGREVTLIHDGMVAAGSPQSFTFDGTGLAAGVYQIQATGSDFSTSRRVVFVK